MNHKLNVLLFSGIIAVAGCSQPANSNKEASDTSSVIGKDGSDSSEVSSSTSAHTDSLVNGTVDSSNNQAPRGNVGKDTVGRRPHDNRP